jgi:hypothetical protein
MTYPMPEADYRPPPAGDLPWSPGKIVTHRPHSQRHVLYNPPEARGELEEEALEVMPAAEAEEGLGQVLPGLGEGDFLAGLLFRDISQILLFSILHEKAS